MLAQRNDHLKHKAYIEYLEQEASVDSFTDLSIDINEVVSRTGYYVCFCRDQLYNLEKKPDKNYNLIYMSESGELEKRKEPICKHYKEVTQGKSRLFMESYSKLIVFVSSFLRICIVWMTERHRYKS